MFVFAHQKKRRRPRWRMLIAFALALVALAILIHSERRGRPVNVAFAQAEKNADETPDLRAAYLIDVTLPIAGEADVNVKRAVERVLDEVGDKGGVTLIFEFHSPPGESGGGSDKSGFATHKFHESYAIAGAGCLDMGG